VVAGVVNLQDPNPRAIIDGRELIQASPRPRDALQELHVYLQSVTGLGLLVALPAFAVRLVLLICRQPRHAVARQDAVDRRASDRDSVKALQVRRDPASAEMIVLAQIDDLADHFLGSGAG
jgi:hypothetical protein